MSVKVDIGAIRARLAAATPGPWAQGDPMFGWSNAQCVVSISDAAMGRDVMSPSLTPALFDVDLIAHAPADLAALCDEVEALTARAEKAEAAVQRVRAWHHAHECREGLALTGCAIIHGGACANRGRCSGCSHPHPCPTLRALDGAE